MNLKILGHGVARGDGIERFSRHPAFRKATRSMILACAALDAAFESGVLRAGLEREPERFGLVLSSAFGELETTKDFLQTLADTGMARPLLFQNSLHNSTTGFASIFFSFKGPVLTTSHGIFYAEHALEAANLLLERRHCDVCVVATVETFLPELADDGGGAGAEKKESAHCLVVSRSGLFERFDLRAKGSIEELACHRPLGGAKLSYGSLFLGAENTLGAVLERLEERETTDGGELRIEKPGSSYSYLRWRRE